MKFYIDSADIEEIKEANQKALVDGVTTNPTLIAKTGQPREQVIEKICSHVKGWVSAEVVGVSAEEMIEEGLRLSRIAANVVVKLPMSEEGLVALNDLAKKGVKTNITLVFSPIQALMVAKAGATLVSPFVGRLDDICTSGMEVVQQIRQIYTNYQFETQILVASVRHPLHILEAALIGADVVTVPFKVLKSLTSHPLTEKGIAQFLKDANSVPN